MNDKDIDLLKRLLDDELLTINTIKEAGNRILELISENKTLRDKLEDMQ